jgi:hypothetical protein
LGDIALKDQLSTSARKSYGGATRADADAHSARPEAPPDTLWFGRWLLDLDAHTLVGEDGRELR